MTSVVYSAQALDDLERLLDFLLESEVAEAVEAIDAITDAVGVLGRHPFIGRPVRGELRELVISQGRTGYVALYRVVRKRNRVEILTLRHPREAGFA